MENNKRKIEASLGQRVYEYQGSDGVTYYSFVRSDATLTSGIQLRLKSRLGYHILNFPTLLRQISKSLGLIGDE